MTHNNQEDWIILVDEDGQEYRYSLDRVLELEDKEYVILIPEIQESAEEEEAHVFRVDTDEKGEEILVEPDEEELDKILEILETEDFGGDFEDDEFGEYDEDEDDNEDQE